MHIIKTENAAKKSSFSDFLRHIYRSHAFESSATLSYYFLFSIFPLAIFISAAFSTLSVSGESLSFLANFVPERVLTILEGYLQEISLGNTASLILIGIGLTVYSMGKVVQTMKRKFRLSYGITKKSKGAYDFLVSLVFVLLIMISFYGMLLVIVVGNRVFEWFASYLPAIRAVEGAFQFLRLTFITCYLFFVLLGIYWLLPGFKQKKRDVLPGTVFALFSWVVMSYLFSFYMDHFSNITTLYGSLSTIIVLLTWLYLVNLILLIGCHINSYLYLTKRNTL